MRREVGPYQIVERRGEFEVRKGRTLLAKYANYLDAEEAAIRNWLDKRHHDDEVSDAAPPAIR